MLYQTYPRRSVKNLNKHIVLDLIRFTPGGISRVEIARQLSLTRAAISSIVKDLAGEGLVREVDGQGGGGRKPIVLEVRPDLGFVLGVDLGSTHISILLADSAAELICELHQPLDISLGPKVCLGQAQRIIEQVLTTNDLSYKDLKAVGLGVPGPVIAEEGKVSGPPIMPGWDNYPIRENMQGVLGCPVSVNNDAELGALGEWAYGAGRGEPNLAYIKVGMGIGAGLLLNGEIYRGSTGTAGEIGHMTIDENGPICSCGNHGCLEALAGGRAVIRMAAERIKSGQRTVLAQGKPIERITPHDVISSARMGDLVSQQIVSEAGTHLGTAVASLVNLFNPGLIVIGGEVAQIGDLLLEPIRQTVQRRSLNAASRYLRITTALLGRRSSAMGAVVEALSTFLHDVAEGNHQGGQSRSTE